MLLVIRKTIKKMMPEQQKNIFVALASNGVLTKAYSTTKLPARFLTVCQFVGPAKQRTPGIRNQEQAKTSAQETYFDSFSLSKEIAAITARKSKSICSLK